METTTIQIIQAIKPVKKSPGVPVGIPAKTTVNVKSVNAPRVSRFDKPDDSTQQTINAIVAKAKSAHDVVVAIDKAYPAILVGDHWCYSKLADIAMVAFQDKQKLH